MGYAIFKKLSEHETVWIGSVPDRGEAEEKLRSLVRDSQQEFYALDLDSGEIIKSYKATPPSYNR